MTDPLLPARFLFRFSAPCLYRDPLWTNEGASLDEKHRLLGLAELEGKAVWADVRAAWSEAGVAFAVQVQGKSQPPWTHVARPEDSDGLHVWIDTRDVHDVHRAGRFCHRFAFLAGSKLPGGVSGERRQPVGVRRPAAKKTAPPPFPTMAEWLPINRAREQPRVVSPIALQARCRWLADGYLLEAFVPAEALTGFDPAEHPRLGFTYAVLDRELGEQSFGVGRPMPYQEDPSLWATLELVR
jgi:hypothetical protein